MGVNSSTCCHRRGRPCPPAGESPAPRPLPATRPTQEQKGLDAALNRALFAAALALLPAPGPRASPDAARLHAVAGGGDCRAALQEEARRLLQEVSAAGPAGAVRLDTEEEPLLAGSAAASEEPLGQRDLLRGELQNVGLLGCGGFAKVELWLHAATGRTYALKTIGKADSSKVGMQQHVRSERLVLAMANSPFVVLFFGSFNRPGVLELLVEPALGGELYATYNRHGLHGSQPHAQFYIACVLSGLLHLHGLHVVLRGVKPEDCVLDSQGWLKLVDMGLAKFVVCRTYTTCGTPDYFAPEVIVGSGHGPPVDWWAMGVLLFELLHGKPPFESAYPMQIYSKVMKGIQLAKFSDAVGPAPKDIIMSLCRADPSDRLPVGPNGPAALRRHSWYGSFDWAAFDARTAPPPYVPTVLSDTDLQNFAACRDDAPKSLDLPSDDCSGWDDF